MKLRLSLLTLAALLSIAPAAHAANPAPLSADERSIVEAERAFARDCAARSMRDGFLEAMAEDGLLFRPWPVNGRQFHTGRPARPGVLAWEPEYAEVARSGDFGWTTGPWSFAPDTGKAPVAWGHYVSVWRRAPGGAWKLAIDLGVSHDSVEVRAMDVEHPATAAARAARRVSADTAAAVRALRTTDRAAAKATAERGFDAVLTAHAAADLRLYREERMPAHGLNAAKGLLADSTRFVGWQPTGAEVSRSGDLGYTYGAGEFGPHAGVLGDSASYVRVWRRGGDGRWKMALEIVLPAPRVRK